jgi:hypothetical protein
MRGISLLSIAAVIAAASFARAQLTTPTMEWARSLPAFSAAGDTKIIPLQGGQGYAIAGSCSALAYSGSNDLIFLIKTDCRGNTSSGMHVYNAFVQKLYGTQEVKAALELPNGDIVLVGTRKFGMPYSQNTNVWIMRIDASGTKRWLNVFGAVSGDAYKAECAIIMKNGDICVGGQRGLNAWVGCIGQDGATKWSNIYDGEKVMSFSRIKNSSWPGVTAVCLSNTVSPRVLYFDRIDWNGAFVSSTYYGNDLECKNMYGADPAIRATGNSETLISEMNLCNGLCQVTLYGADATFQWEHDFSMTCKNETLTAISTIGDEGCIIAGTRSFEQENRSGEIWITGLCKCGKVDWMLTISTDQTAYDIIPASDHEFIVLSKGPFPKSNFTLTKYNTVARPLTGVSQESRKVNFRTNVSVGSSVFDVQGRLVSGAKPGRLSGGIHFYRNAQTAIAGANSFGFIQR